MSHQTLRSSWTLTRFFPRDSAKAAALHHWKDDDEEEKEEEENENMRSARNGSATLTWPVLGIYIRGERWTICTVVGIVSFPDNVSSMAKLIWVSYGLWAVLYNNSCRSVKFRVVRWLSRSFVQLFTSAPPASSQPSFNNLANSTPLDLIEIASSF